MLGLRHKVAMSAVNCRRHIAAARVIAQSQLLEPKRTAMQQTPPMNPGDDAPEGTPGTGEDLCPRCHGSGKIDGKADCPDCGGTGKIIEGIGGG